MQARKADKSQVITAARQAAQTAEDARTLTLKRKQDAELASAHGEAAQEKELRLKAEAALRAQTQASADRMELDRERTAREQAESQAAAAQQTPPPVEIDAPVAHPTQTAQMTPPVMAPMTAPMTGPMTTPMAAPAPAGSGEAYGGGVQDARAKRDLRMNLYQQLSGSLQARDTPAGLVVTIPDSEFHGGAPGSAALAAIARVDSVLAAHPGLMVEVDGNSDSPDGDRVASERATMVREALVRGGLPPASVTARGLGSGKLLGPNRTTAERAQNRRIEIVITGDQIGNLPYWDKTYSVMPK
jgi:flagellar motor protein MotB